MVKDIPLYTCKWTVRWSIFFSFSFIFLVRSTGYLIACFRIRGRNRTEKILSINPWLKKILLFYIAVEPKIVSENHFKINVGDDGDLYCRAKGFPLIYFSWKFYNRNTLVRLSPLENYTSRFSVSHSEYDSQNEVGSSKLQLTNVQKEDYQMYTCIAENSVGSVEHLITLEGCGKGIYFAVKGFIAYYYY